MVGECPSVRARAGFQRLSVFLSPPCSGVFPREHLSPWLPTWKICSRSRFASSHCDLLQGGILIRKSLSSWKKGKASGHSSANHGFWKKCLFSLSLLGPVSESQIPRGFRGLEQGWDGECHGHPSVHGMFQLTAPSQATQKCARLRRIIQLLLKDGSTEAQ